MFFFKTWQRHHGAIECVPRTNDAIVTSYQPCHASIACTLHDNQTAATFQLVGQSGRFLGIAYNVLLMPGKRIRISATHSSWKKVNRKVLDRYLVEVDPAFADVFAAAVPAAERVGSVTEAPVVRVGALELTLDQIAEAYT